MILRSRLTALGSKIMLTDIFRLLQCFDEEPGMRLVIAWMTMLNLLIIIQTQRMNKRNTNVFNAGNSQ